MFDGHVTIHMGAITLSLYKRGYAKLRKTRDSHGVSLFDKLLEELPIAMSNRVIANWVELADENDTIRECKDVYMSAYNF